jgi:chitinase
MNPTILLPILLILAGCDAPPRMAQSIPNPNIWVTAYYACWMENQLPPDKIDCGAVTHIIHFAIRPNADGTLNAGGFSEQAQILATVQAVHRAGKKILIAVGGWWCRDVFEGAMSSSNRPGFINNLVDFMVSNGYDGIDIDMEDMQPQDAADYIAFIKGLRFRLDQLNPRPLLTAAVGWEYPTFASLKNEFDQINLMTYDFSGAWGGWVVWHNSPIYNGNQTLRNGAPLPSADSYVNRMLALGVPANKIGIGIDFYGYVWSGGNGTPTGGVTEPTQRWSTPPAVQANVPYSIIMDTYYERAYLRWDSLAQASYLSIDKPGSSDDKFISFDSDISCQRKVKYAMTKGLGGVIIWELGGGWRPSTPIPDYLLQAVKAALSTGE